MRKRQHRKAFLQWHHLYINVRTISNLDETTKRNVEGRDPSRTSADEWTKKVIITTGYYT